MASIFPPCDERLLQAIKECSCAAIIAHRNPDGDALYSSLAMGRILEKMGKEVLLLNEGPFLRDDIKYLEEFFKDEADKVFIDRSPKLTQNTIIASSDNYSGAVLATNHFQSS